MLFRENTEIWREHFLVHLQLVLSYKYCTLCVGISTWSSLYVHMNFTEQGRGLHSKQCFYFSVKET